MAPDPKLQSFNDSPQTGHVPPSLPASEPLVIGSTPPSIAGPPPPLPAKPACPFWSVRKLLAILLSLGLGLFLADAIISLLDDSLILFLGHRELAGIRGMVGLFTLLMAVVIYALIGLTPMIPKRVFLPITLFSPVAVMVMIPCLIYCYGRVQQVAWLISFWQVLFGLSMLYVVQGGFKFRWLVVTEHQLEARRFSWLNLSGFVLVNALVLLPAVAVYLVLCAALAVDHFSEGFVALRPAGLTVQARTYARPDGKTIQLLPMSHIGEPAFYRKLVQSLPPRAMILMEGVTDEKNLLTNKISYKRMATSLGLTEQQREFRPSSNRVVRADVDIGQFGTNTIDFLNLAMLFHAKGLNAGTVLQMMQYQPPPGLEEQLFGDLLRRRNRRLLEEIQARLAQEDTLIVPWGAAHMPEIAEGIQRAGFRLRETREYVAIRFR